MPNFRAALKRNLARVRRAGRAVAMLFELVLTFCWLAVSKEFEAALAEIRAEEDAQEEERLKKEAIEEMKKAALKRKKELHLAASRDLSPFQRAPVSN